MAEITIVRVDGEGEVQETLHDSFASFTDARAQFARLRFGEAGTTAAEAGGALELRTGGVVKMTTAKAVPKDRKKRASKASTGSAKKPKAAKESTGDAEEAPAGEEAPEGEEAAPEMRKMTGYQFFNQQNREAAKSAVAADPELADADAKARNQAIMTKLGAMWKELDADAKKKWSDDAPEVEKKPKKAKKEPKAPKEKKATGGKRATVTDKAALEAAMEAAGWVKEEKIRDGKDDKKHVDKYFINPNGGKKLRSIVEVARAAFPEFLQEGAAAAGASPKKPAAKKPKAAEKAPGKTMEDYYLKDDAAAADDADGDAAMGDDADADEEPAAAEADDDDDGDEAMADAPPAAPRPPPSVPAPKDPERARDPREGLGKNDVMVCAAAPRPKASEVVVVDDGGKQALIDTLDHRAAEAADDAAERESDDPRAREAWAYRAAMQDKVNERSVLDRPDPSEISADKTKELVNKAFTSAHPPLNDENAAAVPGTAPLGDAMETEE